MDSVAAAAYHVLCMGQIFRRILADNGRWDDCMLHMYYYVSKVDDEIICILQTASGVGSHSYPQRLYLPMCILSLLVHDTCCPHFPFPRNFDGFQCSALGAFYCLLSKSKQRSGTNEVTRRDCSHQEVALWLTQDARKMFVSMCPILESISTAPPV